MLLDDFSLEMTGKDVGELAGARVALPPGTRINVTFLGHEDLAARLAAAHAVRAAGFIPVPHVSARRLASRQMLEEFLAALRTAGVSDEVFVVSGDPSDPHGPYPDSLSIIESGLLERYGVRRASIAGYPEGHPDIPYDILWEALTGKSAALRKRSLDGDIITQFGFDTDPVLDWIAAVRERGIDSPVRIGVPGPAGVRRLLRYAARFGVATSTSIARKYGLSITNLVGTAGPGEFLRTLATDYHPETHGQVKLHFYTFGGLQATAEWIRDFAF
ncbi:methylenetetrahydrofolate reductase [Paractinoplanes atraurantiacus]|uniref:Methylenetetrahydrofolate reductase (NADPH) n=1 Tax=Paractinoplanes atraurantiacus TaxID=1036182 RepID=A0A285JVF6_9ACTN|nr:methylenetetrahydrofolate reductase [Actinoplanes atraurantiacus]SNY64258.1 methylenetetrahydrofolate reductase (NADPH) [Actinoplanes atraurantiacus]